MVKIIGASLAAVALVSCTSAPDPMAAARADLAPSGTLKAAINYGNPVLTQGTPAGGDLRGITVDLARELGKRLGVPVELVPYDAAGKVTDAVKTGAWNIAFLAVDPTRANDVTFTAPYVEIEGTYLVPGDSPLKAIEDVDREGVRIAVGAKSALRPVSRPHARARAAPARAVGRGIGRPLHEGQARGRRRRPAGARRIGGRHPRRARARRTVHGDRAGNGRPEGTRRRRAIPPRVHRER